MSSQREKYLEVFNTINFEQIKDHPNILIAAKFWDKDRYWAAKTCYKFMRAIDDLIDNHKASYVKIAENEKKQFVADVDHWINQVIEKSNDNPLQKELIDTIGQFQIPLWPMEAFAKSMIYDIHHDGFRTLQDFMDYAKGASVAPASIFVHLCGIREQNGKYSGPNFDVKKVSTPCAVFSYLVHIIRDFQKDQLNNLTYFANDLLVKNGLTRKDLKEMAQGATIKQGFRELIREYYKVADEYRLKTYHAINEIWPCLEPRYQLSLEIIFNLYLMVFERIDIDNGHFTEIELNPTAEEIKQRVYQTILESKTMQ